MEKCLRNNLSVKVKGLVFSQVGSARNHFHAKRGKFSAFAKVELLGGHDGALRTTVQEEGVRGRGCPWGLAVVQRLCFWWPVGAGDRPQADPSPLPPEPLNIPALLSSRRGFCSFSHHHCALNAEIFKCPLPFSPCPRFSLPPKAQCGSVGLSGTIMPSSQSWTVATPSCEGCWGWSCGQGRGKRRPWRVTARRLCHHWTALLLDDMCSTNSWATTSISGISPSR